RTEKAQRPELLLDEWRQLEERRLDAFVVYVLVRGPVRLRVVGFQLGIELERVGGPSLECHGASPAKSSAYPASRNARTSADDTAGPTCSAMRSHTSGTPASSFHAATSHTRPRRNDLAQWRYAVLTSTPIASFGRRSSPSHRARTSGAVVRKA